MNSTNELNELQKNVIINTCQKALHKHYNAGLDIYRNGMREFNNDRITKRDLEIRKLKDEYFAIKIPKYSKFKLWLIRKGWIDCPDITIKNELGLKINNLEDYCHASIRRFSHEYAFPNMDESFPFNMSNVHLVVDSLILDGYGKPLSITLQELLVEIDKAGLEFQAKMQKQLDERIEKDKGK